MRAMGLRAGGVIAAMGRSCDKGIVSPGTRGSGC